MLRCLKINNIITILLRYINQNVLPPLYPRNNTFMQIYIAIIPGVQWWTTCLSDRATKTELYRKRRFGLSRAVLFIVVVVIIYLARFRLYARRKLITRTLIKLRTRHERIYKMSGRLYPSPWSPICERRKNLTCIARWFGGEWILQKIASAFIFFLNLFLTLIGIDDSNSFFRLQTWISLK